MKKLFLAIALLASVASCTKDDVINESKEAIGFGNPFIENSTKATDPSYSGTADFTTFKVWGTVNGTVNSSNNTVAIFANDAVSGTVGSGEWTSTKKNYWIAGANYNFAALANAGTVTLGSDKLPATVTYTALQGDLVYAKSIEYTGLESGNPLVALTFNHLLSLVNFTVKNGSQSATGYSFNVKNIKITGTTEGKYYIQAAESKAAGTWEELQNGDYYFGTSLTVNNSTSSDDCDEALLVIPGTVTVSFDVETCVNGTAIGSKSYSKSNITLAAGNSYNFVVEPKVGEEIKFSVASDPTWTTKPDITIQ